MATFTQTDIDNSNRFAEANNKIRLVQAVYRKVPHLASHLRVSKRPATDADFYIPASLRAVAHVVDVEITKTLCDALSCNPAKEQGMCTPDDTASYYYVGDNGWDVQCQPACFNTMTTAAAVKPSKEVTASTTDTAVVEAIDKTDPSSAKTSPSPQQTTTTAPSPHTPMLNFHNDKCRLVNSPIVSYLEKPYYRSSVHYETRLNDMPTGFSRKASVDNPYGSGLDYKTNATYCRYYDRTLMEDGACSMEMWEKVLDSVVGMSLINTVKSAIRTVTNTHKPFPLPENLPKLPTIEPMSVHTVAGWKANIDSTFVVPQLIEMKPNFTQLSSSQQQQRRQRRDITAAATTNNLNEHDLRRKKELEHYGGSDGHENMSDFMKKQCNIPHRGGGRRKRQADGGTITTPAAPPTTQQPTTDTTTPVDPLIDAIIAAAGEDDPPASNEIINGGGGGGGGGSNSESKDEKSKAGDETEQEKKKRDWITKMYDGLVSMVHTVTTDPNFWLALGINVSVEKSVDYIRALCIRLVDQLVRYVNVELFDIGAAIGGNVLSSCLRGLSVKLMAGTVVRIGSKAAIMTVKLVSAAASVVGWLLIGAMIFDLIFTFWDPYGYKNLFPPKMPETLMVNGEMALHKAMESATADYDFGSFVGTVLSHDEIITIQVQSLTDRLVYLDSLIVNSEGSRIDKGEPLYFSNDGGGDNDLDALGNHALAKRVHFDPCTYQRYNQAFIERTRITRALNRTAVGTAIVGLVLWLLFNFGTLGVLLVLMALCLLALNRNLLQNDIFVDLVKQLRIFRPDKSLALHATPSTVGIGSGIGQTRKHFGIHKLSF